MIEKRNFENGVLSIVRFSDCEKYRYTLTRTWDKEKGKIVFIGLNPSTADEIKNDPTVSRMVNFAKRNGFGAVTVLNLFSFRALPSDLRKADKPIGKENNKWIFMKLKTLIR